MGSKENKFVDKTILNTPQPTATSTVEKKKSHKRIPNEFKQSLSMVSIDELSRISEDGRYESNASYHLQEQRSLAESSLLRANNIVAGIPSRYFIPNTTKQKSSLNISDNSTVNESDLLRTPADSSTPRSSIGRASLSQSVAQLSYKIKNTDISIDNFVEEFQKAMKSGSNQEVDSLIFKPAEEAASMLLADELSWRKKNELPIIEEGFSEANLSAKSSIGEFFRQRSDTLSVLGAVSPTKPHKPIPLIDDSLINKVDFGEEPKKNKSLSISAIQKCLQSDDTPRKAADFLLKQSNEYDFSRYLLEKKMEKVSPSMSKDSSCTSDPSEELLKCIFDKENVDTLNTSIPKNRPGSNGSPTSRSSSRALTSLPDGKLPIESTASELIWGCVKTDKCVTQEFSIRNKSAKRLCIQMAVTGHDYKIRKDNRFEADLLSSTKVILHPFESKIIIVSFVPTRVGKGLY